MRAPDFWARDGALPRLLEPAAALWRCAGALEWRWARPEKVPGLAVVCIGNLVVGGAGKTPLVLALGALLQQRGVAVAALARGYGGSAAGPLRVDPEKHLAAEVGDEALLLARALPAW
ncbi:MAG: tetraacyldisaccharide 4'-kinase, partial [Kiloniellales bacterium]